MNTKTFNDRIFINSNFISSNISSNEDSGVPPVSGTPGTNGTPSESGTPATTGGTAPAGTPATTGSSGGSGSASGGGTTGGGSDSSGTPPDGTPPPVTPPGAMDYHAIASQLSAVLTTITEQVPDLLKRDKVLQKAQASKRGIREAFIQQAIATVQAVPLLQQSGVLNTAEAIDGLNYIRAFGVLVSQLKSLLQDLVYSVDAKKATYGDAALQIYDLTSGLARGPKAIEFSGYVDLLKKALGRAGKKKTTAGGTTPPVTPAPAPAPLPATPAQVPQATAAHSMDVSAGPTVYVSSNPPGGVR